MKYQSGFKRGTYAKIKRAWLLTWEWAGDHAHIKDKIVTVVSSRFSYNNVKKILEQYYVRSYLSLHEQFAYVKSKKHCPHQVQKNTIAISEKLQKESSLPSQIPFTESMIIGGNPWLWARIVYDLETWIDENDIEYLKWKEQKNITLDNGEIKSDWKEVCLRR